MLCASLPTTVEAHRRLHGTFAHFTMQAKRRAGKRRVRFPFVGVWKVAPELLGLPSESALENYEAAVRNEQTQEAKFQEAAVSQLKGMARNGNGLVFAIVLEQAPLQELNAVYLAVRADEEDGIHNIADAEVGNNNDDCDAHAECEDDAPSEPDIGPGAGLFLGPAAAATAAAAAAAAAAAIEAAAACSDAVFECPDTGRRIFRLQNEWCVGRQGSRYEDDVDCVVQTSDGRLPAGSNDWAVRTTDGSWIHTAIHIALLTKKDMVVEALKKMKHSGNAPLSPRAADEQ